MRISDWSSDVCSSDLPYVDGNGRLHRWLFHHVLASAGFNPPGMVFPISAVILRRIDAYKSTLTSYSGPLLPFIEWEPTPEGNVRVLNDTADFYRFFDATARSEEHTSELQSLMRISYAVFCLNKKKKHKPTNLN